MKRLLIDCFYNEMTLQEAIEFITSAYREAPSARSIEAAKKSIKACNNIDWE